jgi:hypothetical protein
MLGSRGDAVSNSAHADRMFDRVIATDEGTTISRQAQIPKRAKRT